MPTEVYSNIHYHQVIDTHHHLRQQSNSQEAKVTKMALLVTSRRQTTKLQ